MRRLAPTPGQGSVPVYGQLFKLHAVEGPDAPAIRSAKRVVIVGWSLAADCSDSFPFNAVRVSRGDAFVLSRARPQSEWVNSMPTFDVRYGDWVHIPSELRHPTPDHEAMTVAEYRKFFPLLPTSQDPTDETRAAWRRLVAWADANPRLAVKHPAFGPVCTARLRTGGTCMSKP